MLCGAVHDFFVVPKNVFPDPEWCLGMLSASVTVNEWIVGGPFLNLARSKDGEPRNKYVAGVGGSVHTLYGISVEVGGQN